MPNICYTPRTFSGDSKAVIEKANEIAEEYKDQGFTLTLRQVFYQFVARGLAPNTEKSYKRIGSLISDGRLAGLIDWELITDRTRFLRKRASWENPGEILEGAAEQFHVDLWKGQKGRPEVHVEKDALVDIVRQAVDPWDVPYFSCRGYVSQSEMWVTSQRILERARKGQGTIILYLGDHDPSGLDMTEDIRKRLTLFCRHEVFTVRRLALNMDQVKKYNPPPNPAKITDSRAQAYIAEHGDESWELDALDPPVLVQLIQSAIQVVMTDRDLYKERQALEEKGKAQLLKLSKTFKTFGKKGKSRD